MYEISKEESGKIDLLRAYFIVMVVFVHMYNDEISATGNIIFDGIEYIISAIIVCCAVPGFFVISSILLYRKDFIWKSNIYKKIKRLLIPYFILNTFWVFFYAVAQASPLKYYFSGNNNNIIANWSVFEWLNAYLGIRNELDILLYPLWFLKSLFILNFFSKIIKGIVDKFPKTSFLLVLASYLLDVNLIIIDGSALFFFVIGYFIVKLDIHFKNFDKIRKGYIMVLYLTTIILDFLTREMVINSIIHKLCVIVGLIFFTTVMTRIKNVKIGKVMLFISKYSMGIYLFHEMSLSIIRKIILKIIPQSALIKIIEYFSIPCIIILWCLILCVFLQKYFPKLYCVVTGDKVNVK